MGMFGSSKRSAGSGKSSGPSADDDGSGFLHPESTLASNRSLRESEWSKERSSQQLELEDVHAKSEGGCCRRLIEYAVQGLLFVDAAGGIASIVYGSLLITQFEKPAMAAATFCLILGTAHLATSLVGVLSLFLGGCSRAGLIVSGFMGPYFAMVYLTILISFLVDESGFLTYLDDHKEVMYLGPNVAQNVKNLMPLLYAILIVLGMLEASRFCVLTRLHERLRERDASDALVPRSSRKSTAASGTASAAMTLSEALLEDTEAEAAEAGGGGSVRKESTGTPNWWDNS